MIWIYRFLIAPLGLLILLLLTPLSKKLRLALEQRRSSRGKPYWFSIAASESPLWIHAASGEFEYARPVIRELKRRFPHIKILVTFSSPSFAAVIKRERDVDWSAPLPLDLPGPMDSFLNHIRPRACLLARTDIWPELVFQLKKRKIPIWIFSVTQSSSSKSIWLPIKAWLLSQLDQILCVTENDARDLKRIGTKAPITAIGDTRYDQVLYRLDNSKKLPDAVLTPSPRATVVLGSTWAEDEEAWLPAYKKLGVGNLRWIWVPHETTEKHLAYLEKQLAGENLRLALFSQLQDKNWDILLVDQVGWLAEIYQIADLAFVGGSFRKQVHSVMEPLAAGVPTIVGPFHRNNREAMDFQNVSLPNSKLSAVTCAHDTDAILTIFESYPLNETNKNLRLEIKNFLQQQIQSRTGASRALVERLNVALSFTP